MLDKKFWKKYFIEYDVLNELIPYQELCGSIFESLSPNKDEKILDVGSGTGNVALRFSNNGVNVYGIDMMAEGVELHKKKDATAKIVIGDITETLPFEDCFFDGVYSNNTIYTIPRKQRLRVFKEMWRVLKPGGKIVVSNVVFGFSPFSIYKKHIKKEIKKIGILRSIFKILRFIIPTVKMFYYNTTIKKHTKDDSTFLDTNEQLELLKKAGFNNISSNIRVYADQAVLNSAIK